MSDKKPATTEEALAALRGAREQRVTLCRAAIEEALEEYACTLEASVVLRRGQVIPQVEVTPKEI